MKTRVLSIVLFAVARLAAAQSPPATLTPVSVVGLYDQSGHFVGNLQSVDLERHTAVVAFRFPDAEIADVVLLRYLWRDRATQGPGSEWFGPNQPSAGTHDSIFHEGANCTGRTFLAQKVSPTPRFVGVSGDHVLWISLPRAVAASHEVQSRLTPTGAVVGGTGGVVRCDPLPAQLLLSVEVSSAGDLDSLFALPLQMLIDPPVPPPQPRRRAARH